MRKWEIPTASEKTGAQAHPAIPRSLHQVDGLDAEAAVRRIEEAVRRWWPSCRRIDLQPLWNKWLHRFDVDLVLRALEDHAGECPDELRPSWKDVGKILGIWHLAGSAGKPDWEVTVQQIRRLQPKVTRNLPDEEVLRRWIEMNSTVKYCWAFDRLLPDPDGRRGRLAASARIGYVRAFIQDFREKS